MAFISIPPEDIVPGKAVKRGLMRKIKDSLDWLKGQADTMALGQAGGNGSFETDADANGSPDLWAVEYFPGGSGGSGFDTADFLLGTRSFRFTHPGGAGNGGGKMTSDYFAVSKAQPYALRFGMKSTPTVYPLRANSTAYNLNDIIRVGTDRGVELHYLCTVPGITAGAPPTYPTTEGATIVDGAATFQCTGLKTKAVIRFYADDGGEPGVFLSETEIFKSIEDTPWRTFRQPFAIPGGMTGAAKYAKIVLAGGDTGHAVAGSVRFDSVSLETIGMRTRIPCFGAVFGTLTGGGSVPWPGFGTTTSSSYLFYLPHSAEGILRIPAEIWSTSVPSWGEAVLRVRMAIAPVIPDPAIPNPIRSDIFDVVAYYNNPTYRTDPHVFAIDALPLAGRLCMIWFESDFQGAGTDRHQLKAWAGIDPDESGLH